MGAISALQQQVQTLQAELNAVRTEILKYKYREANMIPSSSHVTLLSTGAVSVAALPPAVGATAPQPLPPPPPASPPPPPAAQTLPPSTSCASSMYVQPTSAADYGTISSDQNVSYFG